MNETTHQDVARWLTEHGVTTIYAGTGGNNEVVVVDAPALPVILAYTPMGDESWSGYAYPRRADGDAYLAFWEGEGTFNGDGQEPDEDAPVEVVGAWILNQIATYRPLPVCPCPDHSNGAVEATECVCTPECVRGEARQLDFSSREAMIAWLVENDHNGCYTDEDAILEWGEPHTLTILLDAYRGVMNLE
jgi:hypothetical protein